MPTALLIHGITNGPGSTWRFQEWLEGLGYDVQARAQLAHGGRGPAPSYRLSALADDLLTMGDHDLVLGHSLGGSTVTIAAAKRPGFAKRLVLLDPATWIPPEGNGLSKEALLGELDWSFEQIQELHPTWDARDIQEKVDAGREVYRPGAEAILDDNPDWDLRDDMRSLAMPTLVMTGDPAVFTIARPKVVEPIVAANPNITYVPIPGTGHNPHRDDPAKVHEVLFAWLEQTA